MSAQLRSRLVAYPGPAPSISLGFELENLGPETWRGVVVEPVVPWDLRAWVDGQEVAVARPALDLPGRERRLELEAGERVELPCPIVLVFRGHEAGDPFTWTLGTPPPGTVELQASVTAGGERLATDRTRVETVG